MSLPASIFAKLSAAPAATEAIVGTDIYPMKAPQGVEAPYVAWQLIAAAPDNTLNEAAASGTHLVQFSCFATTYEGACALGDAVTADLDNATLAGGERVLSCEPSDGFSDDVNLFIRLVEASIFVPAAA
jgi:hypothetical protein